MNLYAGDFPNNYRYPSPSVNFSGSHLRPAIIWPQLSTYLMLLFLDYFTLEKAGMPPLRADLPTLLSVFYEILSCVFSGP